MGLKCVCDKVSYIANIITHFENWFGIRLGLGRFAFAKLCLVLRLLATSFGGFSFKFGDFACEF